MIEPSLCCSDFNCIHKDQFLNSGCYCHIKTSTEKIEHSKKFDNVQLITNYHEHRTMQCYYSMLSRFFQPLPICSTWRSGADWEIRVFWEKTLPTGIKDNPDPNLK